MKIYDKAVGFPKMHWHGQENKSFYVVMDLLGPSLEDLFCMCGGRFTLKTVLMLADQMVNEILLSYIELSNFTF